METERKVYIEDIHSYAKPNQAVVTHLDLDLDVDFDRKVISGKANITFDAIDSVKELVLDSKDLIIKSVHAENGKELEYNLGQYDPILGSALIIEIQNSISTVTIVYETPPGAEAIQWLDPVQTEDKTHPCLFTQSQAILARTWIPLQDSPGIRFTYTAKIKVPEDLFALMSAENPQKKNDTGIYEFKMEQPIPSYLMALIVGDFEFQSLSERSGVYAEPSMIERCAYELEETEDMIVLAESLYGPYRWERYDLIVLPPSFPFGGMENPRLTFATPTIIAGDRSLVSLVAHELAHSWSGNLVTNATWNDFWINEGFTVYFEQRIMEGVYGRDYAEMLASLSQQELVIEVDEFINEGKGTDTKLKLDLAGRNPDDGVTSIPYDKGYSLLRYLEEMTGRVLFDPFIKEYFNSHAFQTMTTEGFLDYLRTNLFEKNELTYPKEEIDSWVYEEGLPATLPEINSDRFKKVEMQIQLLQGGISPMDLSTDEWSTHEWIHFIKNLPVDISLDMMRWLDLRFKFTQSNNAEIQEAWYVIAIRNNYEAAYPEMEKFLIHTGRRKFLTPIYTELIKNPKTIELASIIYKKARPNYHFVSTSTIDKLLDWEIE